MRRRHLLLLVLFLIIFNVAWDTNWCDPHPCLASCSGGPPPTPTAVPTIVPTPTPGPPSVWETLGGNYAYDSPCAGGTGDPIGTILITSSPGFNPANQQVNDRLLEIGMTSSYNIVWTTRDSYRDQGVCAEGAITRATNEGWHLCLTLVCVDSRWHARCIVHSLPSLYGYWASCAPHWDSPACPNDLGVEKHYVPPVYNGTENYSGSGYDAARDWMWWQLVDQYGMTDSGPVYFANTGGTHQCTGQTTYANGKVNVITLR